MYRNQYRHRVKPESTDRTGAATVEFAVCLPLLITLTMGTIDCSMLIFLKETITLAAYEGARSGAGAGGTDAEASARATDFLDQRGVTYDASVVTFSSPGFDTAGTLEHVETTVTVPLAGNLIVSGLFQFHDEISATVTMRKEYSN